MNRLAWAIVIIVVVVAIIVLASWRGGSSIPAPASAPAASTTPAAATTTTTAANPADDAAVRSAVTSFGAALAQVSLQSSSAAAQMEEFYGPYVAPGLLRSWEAAPTAAPGRLVSSPWPDHIDISSVTPQPDGTYAVSGAVVEKTSTGDAGSYPVTMTLASTGGSWLITSWSGYPPPTAAPAAGR